MIICISLEFFIITCLCLVYVSIEHVFNIIIVLIYCIYFFLFLYIFVVLIHYICLWLSRVLHVILLLKWLNLIGSLSVKFLIDLRRHSNYLIWENVSCILIGFIKYLLRLSRFAHLVPDNTPRARKLSLILHCCLGCLSSLRKQ